MRIARWHLYWERGKGIACSDAQGRKCRARHIFEHYIVWRPYYTTTWVRTCIYVDKAEFANVIKLKIRRKTFIIPSTHALSRGSAVTLNFGREDLAPIPQLRAAVDPTKMFATSCLHSIYMCHRIIIIVIFLRGDSWADVITRQLRY